MKCVLYTEHMNGVESSKESDRRPSKTNSDIISEGVQRWLGHDLIREYAGRFIAGESIHDLLQGQQNIEEKAQAIRIVAGNLQHTSPAQQTPDTLSQEAHHQNEAGAGLSLEQLSRTLRDLMGKVYFARRMTLANDAFLVAHGIDPDSTENRLLFERVEGDIGEHFDAHGIDKSNQLEALLSLLSKGIDPTRTFYTAPFEVPDHKRAALAAALGTSGGTAYKGGLAVVTAGYGEKLSDSGIKHVFINDLYADLVDLLQRAFPTVHIHRLSEQKSVLEADARMATAQTSASKQV